MSDNTKTPHSDVRHGEEADGSQRRWWKSIGPGLITGAADGDPSGIATYSQAGAKFGFDTLWTLAFTYPFMVSIQMIAARIGSVSGHGLATHIKQLYPRWALYLIIALLAIANTINIGADIAAMGDAAALLLSNGKGGGNGGGENAKYYALGFAIVSLLLQVFIRYKNYERFLKWLSLALFAYIATAFAETVDWRDMFKHLVEPQLTFSGDYITAVVAIFGTTISPYLFFWQSSQEVEELKEHKIEPIKSAHESPQKAERRLHEIALDTAFGMGVTSVVAFFIMLSAAVTLHQHGITQIQSSADAAKALQPIAGNAAFLLFTLGIIGTGMLAVPVLAGSTAYAFSGAFKWNASLDHSYKRAPAFYAVIAVSMLIGMALCFSPVNPIQALYWAAVINGIVSVPIMIIMLRMGNDRRVMGDFTIGAPLRIVGWLATAAMAAAVLALGYFSLRG